MSGKTPLSVAIINGHMNIANYLAEHGAFENANNTFGSNLNINDVFDFWSI